MSNQPKIYGFCPAGCKWETVHKSDFEKSAAYIKQYPNEDGVYILEQGKTYLVKRAEAASELGYWKATPMAEGFTVSEKTGTISYGSVPYNKYESIYKVCVMGVDWAFKQTVSGFSGTILFKVDDTRYAELFEDGGDYALYDIVGSIVVTGATEVLLVNEHAEIRAKDAYEIAVEEGFAGTRKEWLQKFLQSTAIDLSKFDSDGEIVETLSDGTTRTTTITFDSSGNPIKITDSNGNETVLIW